MRPRACAARANGLRLYVTMAKKRRNVTNVSEVAVAVESNGDRRADKTQAKKAAARKTSSNGAGPSKDLDDPELYINRELSLLIFQQRVLEEAQDDTNPLLERLKFLSILGSNLDEFFMVRVAGLVAQVDAGIVEVGPDGMTPRAQLVAIRREVKKLLAEAHRSLEKQLMPALREAGISILNYGDLNEGQLKMVCRYFAETIFPVLTPLAFDPGRPFPHISNLSLNLAILIRDRKGREHFARLKVPDSLPQLVPVNQSAKPRNRHKRQPKRMEFVWIE